MAGKNDGSKIVHVTIKRPIMTIEGYVAENIETGGNNQKEFVVFFGIPYANPPIGEKRFSAPEPFVYNIEEHGRPFKANECHLLCPQMNQSGKVIITGGGDRDPLDCLYLNIYIPKKPDDIIQPMAVMVYFHGGGFYQGSGNYDKKTPESMMRYGGDIILVTINYRLGPFGFLNLQTEKCAGNAGLKDQVQALKWVRDNIECFKGDPSNVTIWGESAGGSCVNFHLISPMSKGLFHKAIIQSGGIFCPWGYTGDQHEMKERYEKYGNILERKNRMIIDKLLEADYVDLLAFHKLMNNENRNPCNISIRVGPSVETHSTRDAFLPRAPKELIKEAEPVPILAGITSQEGYVTYELAKPIFKYPYAWILNDDCFRRFLKENLQWEDETIGECFDEIRKKYFNVSEVTHVSRKESQLSEDQPGPEERNVKESLAKLCADLWFYRFYDNIRLGDLEDDSKPPIPMYIYEFDFVSRLNPSHSFCKNLRGPSHGDDMAYLLPNFYNRKKMMPYSENEEKKIQAMCSLWSSFARTSMPKSDAHARYREWLPYFEGNPRYLKIGEDYEMKQGRMHDNNWFYLNELNRKDEERKASKLDPDAQNTVASYPTPLSVFVETLKQARAESVDSLSEAVDKAGSSNPEVSHHGALDVLEYSTGEKEPSSSALEVPMREDSKRHSPSRSPTSESKTFKDESSKAKKERTCEEDESQPRDS